MKAACLCSITSLVVFMSASLSGEPESVLPKLADLTKQVQALMKRGDHAAVSRLVTEWQGVGGAMPLCRDGQSRLSAMSQVLALAIRQPVTSNEMKEMTAFLTGWERAEPLSSTRWVYQACALTGELRVFSLPEDAVKRWNTALTLLDQAEAASGRAPDWYCAFAELAEAAKRLVDKGKMDRLPTRIERWQQVFDEGIHKWPHHGEIWMKTGDAARALAFQMGLNGWALHVSALLPEQQGGPYARFWWSNERLYPTTLFKSPPPVGLDWPLLKSGFQFLMKQSPHSPRVLAKFIELARKAEDRATVLSLLPLLSDHPQEEAFPVEVLLLEIQQWAIGQPMERAPLWQKTFTSRYSNDKAMMSAEWSPDGRLVFAGFVSPSVQVMEADTGKLVKTIKLDAEGYVRRIYDISVSPDHRLLCAVSGSSSKSHCGVCRVWRLDDWSVVGGFETESSSLRAVAWSPDSTQLVAVGGVTNASGEAFYWTDDNQVKLLPWVKTTRILKAVAWSKDNSKLAFNFSGGKIGIAEPGRQMAMVNQFVVPRVTWVNELKFSPDGQWLAAACGYSRTGSLKETGAIAIFRATDLAPRNDALTPLTRALHTLDWSPDGALIACGGDDGYVYLLDTVTLDIRHWWNPKQGRIEKVRWSPDGSRLAVATSLGRIGVWTNP